jgi:hypothetical protein
MSLSLDLPSSLPSGIYKIALDDLSSIKDEFQEHLSLSSILSIECVEIYSIARSLSKRVMSWIRPTDLNIFSSEDYHWKKNSEGLYLFVHGLQSHPHVWHDYIDQLKEKNPNVDIKAPYVTKRGNCSLEEATEPLKKMVLDYIEKHPGKPICFIGTSNGGRIIAFLSTFLRGYKTAIKVCSIAGVFLGTSVIKTIKKWGISRLLRLTNVILEELDEGSDVSAKLMSKMQASLKTGNIRSFDFFAAHKDRKVSNPLSSLPIIKKGEEHFLVVGTGHSSIVPIVKDFVLQRCEDWRIEQLRA